jgi:hypothetical protein
MFINPLKHNQMFITPTAEQLIRTTDETLIVETAGMRSCSTNGDLNGSKNS